MSDLKTVGFDTYAKLAAKSAGEIKTVQARIDNRAATRQAIIVAVRREGVEFKSRLEWKAKTPAQSPAADWDYHSIAIHHAGNSYSCSADGADQLRKAEATDIASFGHLSYHYAIDCQGIVYEALDIRNKGAHVEGGNTGVVGIVFLSDFSAPGEAGKYGPGVANVRQKRGIVASLKEWAGEIDDANDGPEDKPTAQQLKAASALVKALTTYFKIAKLGGHREYAKTHGTSRACPGVHGLEIAASLRKQFSLATP